MKKKYYILAFALGFLLLSCSKEGVVGGSGEGIGDVQANSEATLTIAMPELTAQSRATVAATPEEKIINSMTVFIVSSGAIEQKISIDPKVSIIDVNNSWNNSTSTLTMKGLTQLDKDRTIYVVANWGVPAEVVDEPTLKDALSTTTAPIATPSTVAPLLLSGMVAHNFASSISAKVQLKRQTVKIQLTLTFTDDFVAALTKAGYTLTPATTKAVTEAINAPATSYIIDRAVTPTGSKMLANANVDGVITTTPKTAFTATIYLYENTTTGTTVADAAKATYLIINIPYAAPDGSTVASNLYKVQIDTKDAANPYATFRNTVYQITGSINGFGQSVITRSGDREIPLLETSTRRIALQE